MVVGGNATGEVDGMEGEKDERGAEDKLLSYCTLWCSMLSFFVFFLESLRFF